MQAKGALLPVVFALFAVNAHYQRPYFSKNWCGCGSHLCAEICLQLCSRHCHLEGLSVNDTSLPSPHLQILQLKCTNYLHSEICQETSRTESKSVSAFQSLVFEETSFVLVEKCERFTLKGNCNFTWSREFCTARPCLSSPFQPAVAPQNVPAEFLAWSISGALRLKQSLPAGISMGCLVTKNFPEIL